MAETVAQKEREGEVRERRERERLREYLVRHEFLGLIFRKEKKRYLIIFNYSTFIILFSTLYCY